MGNIITIIVKRYIIIFKNNIINIANIANIANRAPGYVTEPYSKNYGGSCY